MDRRRDAKIHFVNCVHFVEEGGGVSKPSPIERGECSCSVLRLTRFFDKCLPFEAIDFSYRPVARTSGKCPWTLQLFSQRETGARAFAASDEPSAALMSPVPGQRLRTDV